jgi:subfamily B ATP-binding cassette protein MsbA
VSNGTFLWKYARRYSGWIAIGLLATILFSIATVFLMFLIGPLLTQVLGMDVSLAKVAADGEPSKWPKSMLEQLYREALTFLAPSDLGVGIPILVLLVFVLRAITDFLSGYAFQKIGFGATTDIRNDLYDRLLAQSSRFHARHPSGELVSRVVGDVAQMQAAVSNRLLDLLQFSMVLVSLLAFLFSIHAGLATYTLIGMPLILYPIFRFGRSMRKASVRGQERLGDLAHLVAEGVRGQRVVKAFGAEAYEGRRFAEATRRHLRVNLRAQTLSNLSSPVVETFGIAAAVALLIYTRSLIKTHELGAEGVLQFLFTLGGMYDPIRRLNRVNLILQQALAAAGRVREVMAEPVEVVESASPKAIASFEREIRFEDVRFAYDTEPVLRGIDLTVSRGQVVALVGASGAGKSTLVNLLPRFFDPTGGRVTVDGIDVREFALADLRRLLALVTQETTLFDDTVRANIAYGAPGATDDRLVAAAKAAYADEFVRQLPAGYDTRVGEAGLSLSGGQRQRLAIARALFKNAPILILDEATNQLDTESESLVQGALTNLMQGRTTLVIAHRLSTIVRADQIVVLDQGRIVEQGTHAELLEREGAYKRLYDLQFQV